jgi:hypothetical protein
MIVHINICHMIICHNIQYMSLSVVIDICHKDVRPQSLIIHHTICHRVYVTVINRKTSVDVALRYKVLVQKEGTEKNLMTSGIWVLS